MIAISLGVRLASTSRWRICIRVPPLIADMRGALLTDHECRALERVNLMKALERADSRIYGQVGAAELLAINPTALASRLRALTITPPRPR